MRKLPKTLTHKEFLTLLNQEKRKDFKFAFILGFYQCLRLSEVCKLKLSNIDLDRRFLHLIQAKGHKDRDVPLMLPTIKALRWGKKYLPFKMSARTLQRAITRAGLECLNKHITFHTLRHSGATFYLNEGIGGKKVDIRHIQGLLGHSRLATTEIYTHITPKSLQNVFDALWEE